MRDPRISDVVGSLPEAKFSLDGDLTGRANLAELLAEAGLELWQAPEGFWAVRLKLAPVPPLLARPRRRPLRRAR